MLDRVDQKDLEKILEKRWKEYKRGEKCREVASNTFGFVIHAAAAIAGFLRKIGLAKQIRKEKIAVE